MRTEGVELRGIVPVSIRADEQRGALGNQITAMLGPLPGLRDRPGRAAADRLAGDAGPEGIEAGGRRGDADQASGLRPPTILAQASRLNFSTRAYNLLVTNVPGPQFPLYFIGRELEELAPVPFLAPERRSRSRS